MQLENHDQLHTTLQSLHLLNPTQIITIGLINRQGESLLSVPEESDTLERVGKLCAAMIPEGELVLDHYDQGEIDSITIKYRSREAERQSDQLIVIPVTEDVILVIEEREVNTLPSPEKILFWKEITSTTQIIAAIIEGGDSSGDEMLH